jgi:hypothetical protein
MANEDGLHTATTKSLWSGLVDPRVVTDGDQVRIYPPIARAGNAVVPWILAIACFVSGDPFTVVLGCLLAAFGAVTVYLTRRVWLYADDDVLTAGLLFRRSMRWADTESVQLPGFVGAPFIVKVTSKHGNVLRIHSSGYGKPSTRDSDTALKLIRQHAPEAYARS